MGIKKLPKAWGSAELIQRVLGDTLESWEKYGMDALDRLRKEKPSDYLSFIAKVMGRAVELEGRLADADRPTALTVTWVTPTPLQLPQAIEAEWQALPMELKDQALKDNALREKKEDEDEDEYVPLSPNPIPESSVLSKPLDLPNKKDIVAVKHHKLHQLTEERYKLLPPKQVEKRRKAAERSRAYYLRRKEQLKKEIAKDSS